jgi:Inner membrane protein CreD
MNAVPAVCTTLLLERFRAGLDTHNQGMASLICGDGVRRPRHRGILVVAIAPVADRTRVAMRSNWPHPSFSGRFLPATREIGDKGFTADWQVSALASAA